MNTLRFQLYSWSVTVGQGIRHFLLPGLCNEHVKVSEVCGRWARNWTFFYCQDCAVHTLRFQLVGL